MLGKVAKYTLVCLVLVFVAGAIDLLTMEVLTGATTGIAYDGPSRPSRETGQLVGHIGILVAGCALIAFGWRLGLDRIGERYALLGVFMLALTGLMDSQEPLWWAVLPAVVLPWAFLLVDLDPRHRMLLLGVQWLSSASMLEAWTGEVATVTLLAFGLLHAVAVGASLPLGRMRYAPVAVGVAIGLTTFVAALMFFVAGPTWQRGAVMLVGLLLLAAFLWLARTKTMDAVRLPILVKRPVPAALD